ncbi:uncharacterized protein F5Z01DRAFT_32527 [Emericellopsis atlantica]|uniref:Uncharacterized protein n=1 Tax=Emericellopsis atlantica TaxID=2614577 RepID=A0A9P7ZWK9_9HYPO|nr:uncharacterized protein F5Z01DRAFT_32527 [Emericellopsis atlantica]KAG9259241.1 hypothetical protein F5Z01DRAFT_32527 [Emericellopsis atlantica]
MGLQAGLDEGGKSTHGWLQSPPSFTVTQRYILGEGFDVVVRQLQSVLKPARPAVHQVDAASGHLSWPYPLRERFLMILGARQCPFGKVSSDSLSIKGLGSVQYAVAARSLGRQVWGTWPACYPSAQGGEMSRWRQAGAQPTQQACMKHSQVTFALPERAVPVSTLASRCSLRMFSRALSTLHRRSSQFTFQRPADWMTATFHHIVLDRLSLCGFQLTTLSKRRWRRTNSHSGISQARRKHTLTVCRKQRNTWLESHLWPSLERRKVLLILAHRERTDAPMRSCVCQADI